MRLAILSAFILQGISLAVAGYQDFPAGTWNDCDSVEQNYNSVKGDKAILCKDDSSFNDAVAACTGGVDNNPQSTEQQKKDKKKIFPLLATCD